LVRLVRLTQENIETNSLPIAWFLVQGIIIYTLGIKFFVYLHRKGWSDTGATLLCLPVCLGAVIPSAEIFFRLVELPSQILAKESFEWIRT
jgi:hypothetical protein